MQEGSLHRFALIQSVIKTDKRCTARFDFELDSQRTFEQNRREYLSIFNDEIGNQDDIDVDTTDLEPVEFDHSLLPDIPVHTKQCFPWHLTASLTSDEAEVFAKIADDMKEKYGCGDDNCILCLFILFMWREEKLASVVGQLDGGFVPEARGAFGSSRPQEMKVLYMSAVYCISTNCEGFFVKPEIGIQQFTRGETDYISRQSLESIIRDYRLPGGFIHDLRYLIGGA